MLRIPVGIQRRDIMDSITRDTSMVKIPAAWSAVAAYSALLALCADIRARRAVIERIVAAAQMIRFSFCMVIHHLRGARVFHSVPLHIIERRDKNNCTIA